MTKSTNREWQSGSHSSRLERRQAASDQQHYRYQAFHQRPENPLGFWVSRVFLLR